MDDRTDSSAAAAEDWLGSLVEGDWRTVLAFIAVVAVLFLLGQASQLAASLFPEKLDIAGMRQRLSNWALVQPSRFADADLIRTLGYVPLDPALNAAGRVGALRRIALSTVRPHSPKPPFVAEAVWDPDSSAAGGQGPAAGTGGGRVAIKVGPAEDAQHLVRSIRAGSLRTTRVIAVCTIKEFLNPDGAFEPYLVDSRYVKKADDSETTVIAYLADPLYTEKLRKSLGGGGRPPKNAVWILLDAPEAAGCDDRADSAEEPEQHMGGASLPAAARGAQTATSGAADPEEDPDPRNKLKAWRYTVTAVLLGASVALVCVILSMDFADGSSNGLLIALMLSWGLVTWPLLVGFCISAKRYPGYKRSLDRGWAATTTRGLADGWQARNGYRKSLGRDDRYKL